MIKKVQVRCAAREGKWVSGCESIGKKGDSIKRFGIRESQREGEGAQEEVSWQDVGVHDIYRSATNETIERNQNGVG